MPPELDDRVADVMLRDRRRLQRRLQGLHRSRDESPARALDALVRDLEEAEARIARRRASVPSVTYPASLPITDRRDDLLAAIADHQVVIVAGETGSGKSTQLPKLCLELGRGVAGTIGHTQPRRLAARTVAERVADELGTELGAQVGYTVRFTDRVSDATLVKVMTDGILLAEIQRDRLLEAYDTIIVDEAHERSLNIDFLLGYLTQLLPRRPDLKVIVTSATIDTERFAEHFGGAPVVQVSGRTYPVEVRYRPYGADPDDDRDQTQAIVDAVDELADEGRGDILVFLSGEREIHDTADALRRLRRPDTEVLPLYARLSAAEQHRIFQPHPGRRVVLSTNVAETSLTVPGVRYVIDAGTARISRYSHRLKVQRLPIEPVSRASADQRAGRCGRVAPGICIRLYGEDDYADRPEYTEPEILRTNLASVILQMAALGLGEVAAFPFVDPPDPRSVKDGFALLEELGALDPTARDPRNRLTPLGRSLARLPVDPRLGRMVLEADRNACVREVMVIAAALSIQDPREHPSEHQAAAAEAHRRFADPESDFLSLLRLWDHLRERQRALSSSQFRKLCRAEYLNYLRVREWQDLYSQLRQVGSDLGLRRCTEPADADSVHRSVLAGLLSQIGLRDGSTREYRGARNARFAIAPGTPLAKKPPRWVMAGELVETNRLWARTVARIQPEWAERLGEHLVQRTYSEPRWSRERGDVLATERVTLFGLPLVTGRTVSYGRIDPPVARELFLRHALVNGEWTTHHAFVRENLELVEAVRAMEDRARRNLLVDDETIFEFFDRRVDRSVTSARHFDRWWKRARAKRPDLLRLTPEVLIDPAAGPVTLTDYPDEWRHGDQTFALTYELDPGAPGDGVTVHVPLAVLNQVEPEGFDWQVPGYRAELVAALVRSLPKPLRRQLVPVADHVAGFLEQASPADGPITEVLARHLTRSTGVTVSPDDIDVDRVPDHLRLTFAVEDEDGRGIARGKDLAALQQQLRTSTRAAIARAADTIERSGLRDWSIGTLPRVVEVSRDGHTVRGYPALLDTGDAVAVRILTNEHSQQRAMRAGTRRLLLLTIPSPRLGSSLTNETKLALARIGYGSTSDLLDDCLTAAVDSLVAEHGGPAWDEPDFSDLRRAVAAELPHLSAELTSTAARIVVAAAGAEARLAGLTAPVVEVSVNDARAHLHRLVRPGFVTAAGPEHLPDVLRYVRGIDRRLEKLPGAPSRDRELLRHAQQLEHTYGALRRRWPADAPTGELDHVAWMLEELRVSLFAQVLGTAFPVSEQRVRRELDRLAGSRG